MCHHVWVSKPEVGTKTVGKSAVLLVAHSGCDETVVVVQCTRRAYIWFCSVETTE